MERYVSRTMVSKPSRSSTTVLGFVQQTMRLSVSNVAHVFPVSLYFVLSALKHHTSKLDSFEALESVSTFGFRGEALSSLCALSSSVAVTTATEQDAPMGTVLELDRLGKVKSRSGKVARQVFLFLHPVQAEHVSDALSTRCNREERL